MKQHIKVDLQYPTSPENPKTHHYFPEVRVPSKFFLLYIFQRRCTFPLSSAGAQVPQGSHCQSADLGDLGGVCCFAIPGLGQETINEPEGKREGEMVGDTENLGLKKKEGRTIVLLLRKINEFRVSANTRRYQKSQLVRRRFADCQKINQVSSVAHQLSNWRPSLNIARYGISSHLKF